MAQVHSLYGLGYSFWLFPIKRGRSACFNVAKAATAGTNIAHDEKGGCAGSPTFTDVGAMGFFANSVKLFAPHEMFQVVVVVAAWHPYPNPIRPAGGARGIFYFDDSIEFDDIGHTLFLYGLELYVEIGEVATG